MKVLGFDRRDLKLMWVFLCMNIKDKYAGSRLGSLWAVTNPLFMLLMFTLVFGYVWRIRLPGADSTLSYAIWLISGYGPWLATSEALMAASLSVVGAAGLVKNMPFKTEVLPITAALTCFLPLVVSLGFLALLLLADGHRISWHAASAVTVAVIQFALVIALGLYLSAITVFVRDFGIALPNILMIILFATPIVYPIQSMPDLIQRITLGNPFYIIADGYRRAFVYHDAPNLLGLAYVAVLSLVLAVGGLKLFRRCKVSFEARL
jgi:lipopolysaccharide transport system permease protein